MRKKAYIGLLLLALLSSVMPVSAREKGAGMRFFYLVGKWVDNYSIAGLDTNYICLPEHSWRVAFTNSEVGVYTHFAHDFPGLYSLGLNAHTMPSIELGFNLGYRGWGFGYAWDVKSAYARNWNISFGSKRFGIEFSRQRSTNIIGHLAFNGTDVGNLELDPGDIWITNTYLCGWYALNATHYSHNAAIKQGYIQRKTAGSLLLQLAYFSSIMQAKNDYIYEGIPMSLLVFDDITQIWSQQIAVGLGYGINYTPNKGKFLLHASAWMQLVCYSINHVAFHVPDSLKTQLPGEPYYSVQPDKPVYVTGNMRLGMSWEINEWVHMGLWAQGQNLRFRAKTDEEALVRLENWNWQAHLSIGVRIGAGKKRVKKALEGYELPERYNNAYVAPKPTKIPQWITDFFFCPR